MNVNRAAISFIALSMILGISPRAGAVSLKGESLASIAKRLPYGKGEFESSVDYRTRVARAQKSPHTMVGVPEEMTYNADTEVFTITPQIREQRVCKKHGTYTARTAMNVRFTVTRMDCETFLVDVRNKDMLARLAIHVPRKEAARWKDDIALEYLAYPSEDDAGDPVAIDESSYRTSLDLPMSGTDKRFTVAVLVDRLQLVRSSTGKPIFAVSRAEREQARLKEQEESAAAERKEKERWDRLVQEQLDATRAREDERKSALQRQMPLFAPANYPKYAWDASEERHYIDNCTGQLKARYGARRTSDQVQYACECITWTLEDTYSVAEIAELIKNATRLATVVENIGGDCKRHRPERLGPDPAP